MFGEQEQIDPESLKRGFVEEGNEEEFGMGKKADEYDRIEETLKRYVSDPKLIYNAIYKGNKMNKCSS